MGLVSRLGLVWFSAVMIIFVNQLGNVSRIVLSSKEKIQLPKEKQLFLLLNYFKLAYFMAFFRIKKIFFN